MSVFDTKITLTNTGDIVLAECGYIEDGEIRRMTVSAVVDTGASSIVINEEIRGKLGLRVRGRDDGTLADGTRVEYEMVGPLEIRWKDRRCECDAILMPKAEEVLLGALPLEAMDLTINPKRELIGRHGDKAMHRV